MPCCFALKSSRVPAKRWSTRVGLCEQLEVARRLIARHPERMIQTSELAKQANLSLAHFTRLFAITYGQSPAKYRSDLRLQHARVLLEHGASVASAARQLGYSSVPTFARLFRQKFGVSPQKIMPKN